MSAQELVIYGDFNCPWSLLASRRADLLEADGVHVDWRAVEHVPVSTERASDGTARFTALRGEAEAVLDWLLPGERMPYTLAGFATDTRAAITGYAEGYRDGAAAIARHVLFEAFWNHSVDLADAHVVHTLLIDAIRTAPTPTGDLQGWDYPMSTEDHAGGPSRQSVRRWAAEWRAFADATVPLLVLNDTSQIVGKAAIEWLGRELLNRRVNLDPGPESRISRQRGDDIDDLLEAPFRDNQFPASEAQPSSTVRGVLAYPARHLRTGTGRQHRRAVDADRFCVGSRR